MKYKIGDRVWVADFRQMAQTYVECPDCGGTGRMRVIFHDETVVSIECGGCKSGYEPPTGRISIYRNEAVARLATIEKIEIEPSGVKYRTDYPRVVDDSAMFDYEPDALAHACMLAADYEQEQIDKIAKKEKDTRSWGWNAHYHRKEIKDCQRRIEYHTAKLSVASLKAKDKSDKAA